LGTLLTAVLAVNVVLVAVAYGYGNFFASQAFERELNEMQATPLPVAVNFREFPARRAVLAERGIQYSRLRTRPELLDIPYADELAWKDLLREQAAAAAEAQRRRLNPVPQAGWLAPDPVSEHYFYEVDMRVFLDNCLWAAHLAAGWSEPE
jgi:hypothetical protein